MEKNKLSKISCNTIKEKARANPFSNYSCVAHTQQVQQRMLVPFIYGLFSSLFNQTWPYHFPFKKLK